MFRCNSARFAQPILLLFFLAIAELRSVCVSFQTLLDTFFGIFEKSVKTKMTVHILGAGAVGLFIACKLHAGRIPVSLLRKTGSCGLIDVTIRSLGDDQGETVRMQQDNINSISKVDDLIIVTKAFDAVSAFQSIKTKLQCNSNIVVLCNGAGKVLNDIGATNHNMYSGYLTHGIVKEGPNEIRHTGLGNTVIGPIGNASGEFIQNLNVSGLGLKAVTSDQLENELNLKLGINSCINPVAAILGVKNGFLSSRGKSIISSIASEVGPALGIEKQFLLNEAVEVARKTSMNTNSMLADILNKKRTEIDYINGWVTMQGLKKGMNMKCNETLVQLIKLMEISNAG